MAGFPVGSPMDTVGCYGILPTQVRPRYYEAHDLIKAAWTRFGPFPFNGAFTKLRHVNLWPKPLQKPHPPIWLAGGGSVETWKFATDNIYTYSYPSFSGHKAAKNLIDGYWQQVERAGLDDNPFRAGFAQLVVVGETDKDTEKLYLKHLQNFYSKSMPIPQHMLATPGCINKQNVAYNLTKGDSCANPFPDPYKATWADFTEKSNILIGGSAATVAEQIEAAAHNLRVGHLMVILQIQSMGRELTEYNPRSFADKVLPKLRGLWDKEGYIDHWWPLGVTRNRAASLSSARGKAA